MCVHVYKQTGKHMCVIQAVDVYMYTSKNAHYAQVCTNKCIYVCMYVCVCVYMYVIYLHAYIDIPTSMHAYIQRPCILPKPSTVIRSP